MELKSILKTQGKKILLIVLDGLGDLPFPGTGKTPLEAAVTPNLDRLVKNSATGLHIPVDYGITPGSGPGHLGIFGYSPIKHQIGRGILEALGVGLEVKDTDLAVRGNFATVEYQGVAPIIVDRRAGRIPTEENKRLIEKLSKAIKEIEGVEVILKSGMEHRFAAIFRFPQPLSKEVEKINDTDPQATGVPPLEPKGETPEAEKAAQIVKKFLQKAAEVLKSEKKANYILFRGFSVKPALTPFPEKYGLRAGCVAVYPMYKGLARLVGMEVVEVKGKSIEDELSTLKSVWEKFDFVFFHIKKTDSYGEDGAFEEKVKIIEAFDALLPEFLSLTGCVICITGDHSTPCVMKSHSWHPVPTLIYSPYVLGGTSERFTERECLKGELGIFPAVKLMPLLLAHAERLKKFGA